MFTKLDRHIVYIIIYLPFEFHNKIPKAFVSYEHNKIDLEICDIGRIYFNNLHI